MTEKEPIALKLNLTFVYFRQYRRTRYQHKSPSSIQTRPNLCNIKLLFARKFAITNFKFETRRAREPSLSRLTLTKNFKFMDR